MESGETAMIYLNNAATSYPKPPEVVTAVTEYLRSVPSHLAPDGFEAAHADILDDTRHKLALLLNAEGPNRIVFTSGTTEALNLALFGAGLEGGHVVTTAAEHHSALRPLKTLERDGKITLTIADCDSYGRVHTETLAQALRPATRALVVNHVSNVTGEIVDLKAVGDLARIRRCLLIVDASQSVGSIPVDVQAFGVDLLAFTGHKAIGGLPGSGGLYLKPGLEIKPLKVGSTGVRSDHFYQPEESPARYEAGTPNLPGIIAMRAGLEYIFKIGRQEIHRQKVGHVRALRRELAHMPQVVLYGREDSEAELLCFNLEGMMPDAVGYMLEHAFGIQVRSGLHCAPLIHRALYSYPHGSVRLSPSRFTTEAELDAAVRAIRQICEANQVPNSRAHASS